MRIDQVQAYTLLPHQTFAKNLAFMNGLIANINPDAKRFETERKEIYDSQILSIRCPWGWHVYTCHAH